MSNLQAAIDYAHQHRDKFLSDLIDVLKIPSLSTDAEYKQEVQRAAEWMANHLKSLGIEHVEVMPTPNDGHPVVYGDYMKKPGAKTVLIYGHYDVQPADPLELWETGPFEPQVRGELLYGRGSSDMKGQVIATFAAIESLMKGGGELPVNMKLDKAGEAATLAKKYDYLDDSPFPYYAEAAILFSEGKEVEAEAAIARAGRIFQDPNIIASWQDTMIEFGYVKGFFGGDEAK